MLKGKGRPRGEQVAKKGWKPQKEGQCFFFPSGLSLLVVLVCLPALTLLSLSLVLSHVLSHLYIECCSVVKGGGRRQGDQQEQLRRRLWRHGQNAQDLGVSRFFYVTLTSRASFININSKKQTTDQKWPHLVLGCSFSRLPTLSWLPTV